MRHIAVHAFIALALSASCAAAADVVPAPKLLTAPAASLWDMEFGGGLASDYIYRGFSVSNRQPSVTAYVRPIYDGFYAGVIASSLDLPFRPAGLLDFHAGFRRPIGRILLESRVNYYHFPGTVIPTTNIAAKFDYWEWQVRPTWAVNEALLLMLHGSYAPSFVNTGASATWLSGIAVIKGPFRPLPGWGSYLSAEFGRHWLGTTKNFRVNLPDYTNWNVGAGLVYKAITFDLRYHDTNLSREACAVLTGDLGSTPGGVPSPENLLGLRSNWCGAAIVGKMSFDMTASKL